MRAKLAEQERGTWLAVCRLAVCMLVIGGCLAPAYAGEEESGASARDLIHAYKVWKLTDMLDLSEDQMPAFFAKIKGIEDKEFEISEGEREAARKIGHLLEQSEVSDEDLAQALTRYEDMRDKRAEELRTVRREALDMLSVRQRCNFVVFEQRFRDEMRQMIGRAREIRRGEGLDGLRGGRSSGDRSGRSPGGARGGR